jgi:hypothetical protein
MDLRNIYRIFQRAVSQCTFFSAAHGTFSKIDNILGHKPSLNKFKTIEIALVFYQTTVEQNLESTTTEITESIQTHGE